MTGGSAEPLPRTVARPVVVAVVAVLVTLAAVVGLIVGSRLGPADEAPDAGSVDAGFARDMQDHHSQAVQMSVMVRDGTDDADVRQLALDILLTQQQQAGQMYGWLETWGLSQSSSEPPMAWMSSHAGHGEAAQNPALPGMATVEQLRQLDEATGVEAERIFLSLMIPHHEAGVEMAEYAVEEAEEPAVRELALSIVKAQQAELTVLHEMLDERGGPIPAA